MEVTEQQVIDYIVSRGIPKQLSFHVKPIPAIRIGNDVFRTIVEMSYEMWRCDRIQRHKNEIRHTVRELYDMILHIPKHIKTGKLRSMNPGKTMTVDQRIPCNGKELSLRVRYNTYRYREDGRIKEGIYINAFIHELFHFNEVFNITAHDNDDTILEKCKAMDIHFIKRHWLNEYWKWK